MSLKAFHVVFVTLATLLCITFGVWALAQRADGAGFAHLAAAMGSFLGAAGLTGYGSWFLRKLKDVSYL